MAYSEDIKKVFRREGEGLGRSEITLFDRSLVVISGHKGLLSLTETEIVVRLPSGLLGITGTGLFVRKASPTEIYVEGRISALSYPEEGDS